MIYCIYYEKYFSIFYGNYMRTILCLYVTVSRKIIWLTHVDLDESTGFFRYKRFGAIRSFGAYIFKGCYLKKYRRSLA